MRTKDLYVGQEVVVIRAYGIIPTNSRAIVQGWFRDESTGTEIILRFDRADFHNHPAVLQSLYDCRGFGHDIRDVNGEPCGYVVGIRSISKLPQYTDEINNWV